MALRVLDFIVIFVVILVATWLVGIQISALYADIQSGSYRYSRLDSAQVVRAASAGSLIANEA
jgi:hypothetical protein